MRASRQLRNVLAHTRTLAQIEAPGEMPARESSYTINYNDYDIITRRRSSDHKQETISLDARNFPLGQACIPAYNANHSKATEVFDGCRKYDRLAPLSSVIDPTEDSS